MRFFVAVTMISLIMLGFVTMSDSQDYHPSDAEKLVGVTLGKAAAVIKKTYHLTPCGTGVAMPGGPIQELTLCFDTYDQLSKEHLRVLLIKSAQELLNQINQNSEIQQYLKFSFTIKNVGIIIYNHDVNGREVYDPEISTARISEGLLEFRTVDRNNTYVFKNEFEESYEEALKIIQSNKKT